MNVFELFKSKDIGNVKLGIQLIKTLGYQKEFEKYAGRSLNDYEIVFKGLITPSFDYLCGYFDSLSDTSIRKFTSWLDIDNLSPTLIKNIVFWHPEYLKYFNVNKFGVVLITTFLTRYPHLITEFDLTKITKGSEIAYVLMFQPQLIGYFDLSLLEENHIGMILERQPQLVDKF